MISKIFFARLEPCFQAKKTKNGDASRVKKGSDALKSEKSKPKNVDKTPKTDTFTSAESGKQTSSKKGKVSSKTN